MKTAVQGQIEHLAWRLENYAQETSGGPVQAWCFSDTVPWPPAP